MKPSTPQSPTTPTIPPSTTVPGGSAAGPMSGQERRILPEERSVPAKRSVLDFPAQPAPQPLTTVPRGSAARPLVPSVPLGRPASRPLISHAVALHLQHNAHVEEEATRKDSDHITPEAHFIRNITYMVILRAELSKQYAYNAVLSVTRNPQINRHKVKAHTSKLVSMIAEFDRRIASITRGTENQLTLEYYDGLTDYFIKSLQPLVQTAYFSIMQAITAKTDLPSEHLKILSSCQLAQILLNYTTNRIDREISHYTELSISLERLRYLGNRPLYQRFDLFNDLVSAQLFPKSEQVDLNKDKGVVKAVKNLLSKMSNPTFVSGIISDYNEIFTKEYNNQ